GRRSSLCAPFILHFLFSCLRLPRPQRSTLFPYTTLFRSRATGPRAPHRPERSRRLRPTRGRPRVPFPPRGLPVSLPAAREAKEPDRKSTRLNSSHRTISYAVFCLKKKIHHHHVRKRVFQR